jgi:hypothetical protein
MTIRQLGSTETYMAVMAGSPARGGEVFCRRRVRRRHGYSGRALGEFVTVSISLAFSAPGASPQVGALLVTITGGIGAEAD